MAKKTDNFLLGVFIVYLVLVGILLLAIGYQLIENYNVSIRNKYEILSEIRHLENKIEKYRKQECGAEIIEGPEGRTCIKLLESVINNTSMKGLQEPVICLEAK